MTEEELKALHEDEAFIENFDPKDLNDPDKSAELEKRLASAKTTIHQKRHYRDLAKAGKPGKPANAAPAAKPNPAPVAAEDKKGIDPQVATDFRLDHPELTKEQQKKVIAHAEAYKITPEDALKDPLMQKYIESTTAKEDVEDASPAPGRRSGTSIGERDWSGATPAEMEAARQKMLYPNG